MNRGSKVKYFENYPSQIGIFFHTLSAALMIMTLSPLRLQNFEGNKDTNSIRFNEIPFPVVTTSVTVYPVSWNKNFGFRMELYGCQPGQLLLILTQKRFAY